MGVSSSAGYVRKAKSEFHDNSCYITFYSTYGINTQLGAKDTFEIQITPDTNEVYFCVGKERYKKVLEKNEDGEYIIVR